MEHFKRCKLGQYVDKIDSDREGVNVYVDVKAEHRKSGNAFVYFRKKPLKGGVPYVFVRDTKQLAPMLPHPFLVSEYVKIYEMKDEVAAVKELAKIQVFYCFHYAAAVCNRVEDEFYWGLEDVYEDWRAIIREAFFRYMDHRLNKIPAHMNQEDYDRLKEIAMSAKNSEERNFLGFSSNHEKEMIFDKDCMFDLFCNFISGGFMRKKTTSEVYFSFHESLRYVYDLYPFFKLLIYPASTSWIVTEGILKDVEIKEMTIPAIIVDCVYLNQCFTCRSTVRFHYKYFTLV